MARKPNFSATEIGSYSIELLRIDVEGEGRGTDRDLVPRAEAGRGDATSVHLDAIGRAEVDDRPVAGRRAAQLGVPPRDVRVAEHALRVLGAADRRPRPVEHIAAVLERDDGAGLVQGLGAMLRALLRPLRLAHRRVDL